MDKVFAAALWSMFLLGMVAGVFLAAFAGLVAIPLTCTVAGHHHAAAYAPKTREA